jgi:integrase
MGARKAWLEYDKSRDTWRVRYTAQNGMKKTAGSGDKTFAKKLCEKTQKDLDCKILGIVDETLTARECFDKFITEYALEHEDVSVDSVKWCVGKLLERPTIKRMVDITPEELKAWKHDMYKGIGFKKPLAQGAVYACLGRTKTWLMWCRRNKIISWNPFENVENPQPRSTAVFLTDEELSALEENCSEYFRPILRLGWMSGLRQGEIFGALGEDVTWSPDGSGSLLLRDTKNGKDRVVPLDPSVMSSIGSKRTGLLFPGLNYATIKYHWKILKAKAGINRKVPFHSTRHTFAKKYLENGGHESALEKILGHADTKMISRVYGHYTSAFLSRSIIGIKNGVKFSDEPAIAMVQ